MSTSPSTTLTRANLSEEQLVSASIVSLIVMMAIILVGQPTSSLIVGLGFVTIGIIVAGVTTFLSVRTRTRIVLACTLIGFVAGLATSVIGFTAAVVFGATVSLFGLLQIKLFL